MLVVLSTFLVGSTGCKPKECGTVMDAAGPIQEMAESGNSSGLATQASTLEAAASGTKVPQISRLVKLSNKLAKHVAEKGQKPAKSSAESADYATDKAMYLKDFVDARRDVAEVCK